MLVASRRDGGTGAQSRRGWSRDTQLGVGIDYKVPLRKVGVSNIKTNPANQQASSALLLSPLSFPSWLRKDRPAIWVTVEALGTLHHHVGSEGCRSKCSAFQLSHLAQVSPPSPVSYLPPGVFVRSKGEHHSLNLVLVMLVSAIGKARREILGHRMQA